LGKICYERNGGFSAIRSQFQSNNLPYFTFYTKYQKHTKPVIWHLPDLPLVEDTSDGLVNFGFDVISVKQMSATRRSPAEGTTANVLFFLIALPRTTKSPELFKLTSLCHIIIKAEAYKAQTGLTQLQLPTIRPCLG
jgi:hypothetical protein